ncbi:RagB/SusD family nutrient uptake outer membrane protein [Flammeovirga aprica]|uniref:RagB/SusD family nutrient uptake outer membrane protein n=1 Tax=Flammeovirga aprica JL-4 TaxID=694437 RepID=A0A7X9RX51_9BACT|nr:RagB/SusD family nutrient uptake outer membrane protein [Flammeovirga aprica]NME70335.1 RagB/SusD family nutrient uptake outer membrane protein [Flammeovirga aprica JL-4]
MGIIFTTSCSRFLELSPNDKVTEDNFYNNADDAYKALIGIYEKLRHDHTNIYIPLALTADAMSDDLYVGGGGAADNIGLKQLGAFRGDPANINGEEIWKKCYIAIQRSNTLLDKYDEITFKTNEQKEKDNYKGEALFLRAHFYFELARFFENVPLTLKSEDHLSWREYTQASPEVLYAQITTDMLDAIPLMAESGIIEGRLTSWAAKAELLKMFMFYTGYYQKDHLPKNDGSMFTHQDAIQMVEDLIHNSGHGLLNSFHDIFTYDGDFSKEVVFEISFGNINSNTWGINSLGNMQSMLAGPRGYRSDLLSNGWGFGLPTHELMDLYSDQDKRKKSTFITAKALMEDESGNGLNPSFTNTGAFGYKYTTHAYRANPSNTAINYDQNYHYIRFSDILLIGAELQLTSDISKATDYVNRVRNRAGLENLSLVTLDDIYLERRLELAMEGHRYWDILRRGFQFAQQELDVVNYEMRPNEEEPLWGDIGVPSDFEKQFDAGKRGFWPIPQSELDKCPNFKQNVGY